MVMIYLYDGSIHNTEKKGVLEQKNTTHLGQEQEYDKIISSYTFIEYRTELRHTGISLWLYF